MSKTAYTRTSRAQRARGASAPYRGASWQPRPVNRSPDHQTQGQRSSMQDQSGHYSSEASPAATASDPRVAGQSISEPRSLQSHGPYYSLPPDPKKNAKLKTTAEAEKSEYERHKAEKRVQAAQVLGQQRPARVGGHRHSREDIDKMRQEQEKKQQMEARFGKVRQREKREEYHRQQREKEEEELRKMKQTQREKAKRQKARDEELRLSQQEEIRRKRLERFDQ